MDLVKSACGCALAATIAGVALARLPQQGDGWMAGAVAMFRSASNGPSGPATPAAFSAARPVPAGNTVTIAPDRLGQYQTDIEVEGRHVPAMVDTGASWVSLSSEAAAALGFRPAPSDFRLTMNTANGRTQVAPIVIEEMRVGPIVGRKIKAVVLLPGALTMPTLLGMSFLQNLSGFAIDNGRLVLKQ